NSLRELHPSDYDSLRAAFGRLWRAADAADIPHRSEHLCVRGIDHAGGDRKEECHYADRFCSGGRTEAGQESTGGDIPGLPDSFPAHHDDDDVGAAGRSSDCVGVWPGWRRTAAARVDRGGRTAVLAVDYAVSNACGLHVYGEFPEAIPQNRG